MLFILKMKSKIDITNKCLMILPIRACNKTTNAQEVETTTRCLKISTSNNLKMNLESQKTTL